MLFLTLVALAPAAFGAAPAWAWATLACGFALAVAGHGAKSLRSDSYAPAIPSLVLSAIVCLGFVLLAALAQGIPGLPGAHPLWEPAESALATPVPTSIAVDPPAARAGLAGILMVCGVAWLAREEGCRTDAARHRLLKVVAGSAAVYAGYGLLAHAGGWDTVLWVEKAAYRNSVTGPFVNRNAFAGYLGLALLACSSLLAARVRAEGPATLFGHAWPWSAAWLLLAAALLGTQSRGGIVAGGIALMAWLAAAPRGRGGWTRTIALAGTALVVAGAIGLALDHRFVDLAKHAEQRLSLYASAWNLISERPWLGHGLGSFADMFAAVAPPDTHRIFVHVHNTYLATAFALGIPAAIAAAAAVALLAVNGWIAARQGAPAGRVGFAAAVLLGAHGLIDFAPQVPAVAITGAALLGFAAARPPRPPRRHAAGRPRARWLARQPS
ncbi:O-antigen ligase family protein [Ferruginivarius sediminum]|nr:O-antigen ligase family protein [Ferruginivarius sediminum]